MFVENKDEDCEIPSFQAFEAKNDEDNSTGIVVKVLDGNYQGAKFFITERDNEHLQYSLIKNPNNTKIEQEESDFLCQLVISKITEGFPEQTH